MARLVAQHPALELPRKKEAHVFDAPGYEDGMTVEAVNNLYQRHFQAQISPATRYGDATPIYCLHPTLVERIAQYNPAMQWIIILRHPVERAVSHYHMERGRDAESWSFWAAMLFEQLRLRGYEQDFSPASPLRRHSYRLRGHYAQQFDVLYRNFPRDQVLVLRNDELELEPEAVLRKVYRFLGVPVVDVENAYKKVFEGAYPRLIRGSLRWRILSWLMRRELREAEDKYQLKWR